MVKLVEAKAKSGGLNTDLLNGKNCHVSGFPIGIDDPRSFVVVAVDKLAATAVPGLKFSQLDLAHATVHFEQLFSF